MTAIAGLLAVIAADGYALYAGQTGVPFDAAHVIPVLLVAFVGLIAFFWDVFK